MMKRLIIILSFLPLFSLAQGPTANFTVPPVCEGNPSLFTDSSVNGSSLIINWSWNMGGAGNYLTGTSSGSQSTVFLYDVCGTYIATLIVTDMNGSTDTTSYTVEVLCGPISNFSVTEVCEGDFTVFTDQSTTGSPSMNQWLWDFGDGNTSSLQNPSYTYSQYGIYNVTLTVTNSYVCTYDTTISVIVSPNPIANFNFSATTICEGDTILFTDLSTTTSPLGGNIITWNWDFGTGSSTPPTNAGTYNLILTVTDDNGCADDTTQTVNIVVCTSCDSIEMVVNPLSSQDTIKLNGLANNIAPATVSSWQWDLSNISGTISSNSILQDPMFAVNFADTFIVCLTTTINNSGAMQTCTVCDTLIWNSAWVSYSMGNLVLISDFLVDTVCEGFPTTFTNLSAGGVPPYMYQWDFGDGTTSLLSNPVHVYATCGTYNALLIVTDANGLSDTSINLVVVNCPPVANFTASNVCEGECTYFTDLSISGSVPIINWNWDMGVAGTYVAGTSSSSQSPVFCFNNCGTYNVSLDITDSNGCVSSISMPIQVFCNPIANFLSPDTACIGDTVCFTDASVNGGGVINLWYWDFGSIFGSTLASPCYIYANTGIYNVTLSVTDNNGCEDTTTQSIFIDSCNTSTGLNNYTTSKKLLKVTDILGRETPYKKNTPLFYIYDDGTVEKRIVIE